MNSISIWTLFDSRIHNVIGALHVNEFEIDDFIRRLCRDKSPEFMVEGQSPKPIRLSLEHLSD